jgi:hypothetical protein
MALLLMLLAQAPQAAPPAAMRTTLRQLRDQLDDHRPTSGATPELTVVKHQLRDWIESRLAGLPESADPVEFARAVNAGLAGAGLFCADFQDECFSNLLGFMDDVRVDRKGEFLVVATATGISCGYDESAYVYAWADRQWRRVWELEQNTYTQQGYLPQAIHDVQISSPDARGNRLLMALGSQTTCGGAFKNLYARVWRMDAAYASEAVLDWKEYANDGYPPIEGRVFADEVRFSFTAGGLAAGETHTAIRHFTIAGPTATQVDPIAGLPRDFVVEWLTAPWKESQPRSASTALEQWHAQLHREDHVGDFPDPILGCTAGPDLWQVGTRFFEGPKRYYRVRWQKPDSFTMVDVSEKPYPDCTVADSAADGADPAR